MYSALEVLFTHLELLVLGVKACSVGVNFKFFYLNGNGLETRDINIISTRNTDIGVTKS